MEYFVAIVYSTAFCMIPRTTSNADDIFRVKRVSFSSNWNSTWTVYSITMNLLGLFYLVLRINEKIQCFRFTFFLFTWFFNSSIRKRKKKKFDDTRINETFYFRTCETGFVYLSLVRVFLFFFFRDYFVRFLEIWKRKERMFTFRVPGLLSSREHLLPLSKLFSREKVCWINTSRQETRKNLSNEATHVVPCKAIEFRNISTRLDS